jgi:hypothetical protein
MASRDLTVDFLHLAFFDRVYRSIVFWLRKSPPRPCHALVRPIEIRIIGLRANSFYFAK